MVKYNCSFFSAVEIPFLELTWQITFPDQEPITLSHNSTDLQISNITVQSSSTGFSANRSIDSVLSVKMEYGVVALNIVVGCTISNLPTEKANFPVFYKGM